MSTALSAVLSPATAAGRWLGRRHRVGVELSLLVALYVAYDTSRGLVSSGAAAAVAHAGTIHGLEHLLHLDGEPTVQRLAREVPGLLPAFAVTYTVCHLGVTGAVLLWLYRVDAVAYVRLRVALLLTSVVSLVGFVAWPTAPPRLDGIGLTSGVATIGVNLDSHTLTLLYNPYAAFPSLHEVYAVLAGYGLWRWARRRWLRALGVIYPAWVAVEVIATGNHFVLDIAAAVAVAVIGMVTATRLVPDRTQPVATELRLVS